MIFRYVLARNGDPSDMAYYVSFVFFKYHHFSYHNTRNL